MIELFDDEVDEMDELNEPELVICSFLHFSADSVRRSLHSSLSPSVWLLVTFVSFIASKSISS